MSKDETPMQTLMRLSASAGQLRWFDILAIATHEHNNELVLERLERAEPRTAKLYNAVMVPLTACGDFHLRGNVYSDSKKAFLDGADIGTSRVVSMEAGSIFVTASGSRYEVESWKIKT